MSKKPVLVLILSIAMLMSACDGNSGGGQGGDPKISEFPSLGYQDGALIATVKVTNPERLKDSPIVAFTVPDFLEPFVKGVEGVVGEPEKSVPVGLRGDTAYNAEIRAQMAPDPQRGGTYTTRLLFNPTYVRSAQNLSDVSVTVTLHNEKGKETDRRSQQVQWETVKSGPAEPELSQWYDDFSSSVLNQRWTWVDPNANDSWSLTARQGYLRVVVAYLYGDPVGNAGRVAQLVSGDFEAQTSVTMVDPRNSFQQAGLLVWQDEDNLLRFHRTYSYDNYLQLYWVDKGVRGQEEIVGYAANPTHLRVVRVGQTFTALYSGDGANWTEFKTVELGLPQELEIGLFARYGNNDFGPTFSADFDYFQLQME